MRNNMFNNNVEKKIVGCTTIRIRIEEKKNGNFSTYTF